MSIESSAQSSPRNSSIELLKLVAIVFIVLFHTSISFSDTHGVDGHRLYGFDDTKATSDLSILVIIFFRTLSDIANDIFIICSAYFLIDSNRVKTGKVISYVLDVWGITMITLISSLLLFGHIDNTRLILAQVFPITNANCWFITCYLIIYCIHPALNRIIHGLSQYTLFVVVSVICLTYVLVNFIDYGHFYANRLIDWVVIYLIIGYCKLYLTDFAQNKKANIRLVLFSLSAIVALFLCSDFVLLRFPSVSRHFSLIWMNGICSPFVIAAVFGMFNIVSQKKTYCRPVNFLASLSLFVYVFHENKMMAHFVRPKLIYRMYELFGNDSILLQVFLVAAIILVISFIFSSVYKVTIHRLAQKLSDSFGSFLSGKKSSIEAIMYKIK